MTRVHHPDVRQEDDVVPWRLIALVAAGVIVVTLLLILWAWLVLESRAAALRPSGAYPERDIKTIAPVSGVQEDLFGDEGTGQAMTRRKQRELDRFGWADRERGLVRVPIEEAMRRVAEGAAP